MGSYSIKNIRSTPNYLMLEISNNNKNQTEKTNKETNKPQTNKQKQQHNRPKG